MKPSFKFSLKNNNKNVILVHSDEVLASSDEVFDIILSPRYYWAKKEELPVRYAYQAKSYAPSSFDGVVPEGEYKYLARKSDEGFWLYAYDEHFILSELEKLGLKASQIRKVYFAQVEFDNITKPIKINNHEALTNHNGNIIKVPMQMVEHCIGFDAYMQEHQLSNFSINLNQFGHLIDFKKMLIAAFALFALMVLYGVHYHWLGVEQEKLDTKHEAIREKFKMPSTTLQTDALIRQLEKKANEQIHLREKFYQITKAPFAQKEYFLDIVYGGKKFNMNLAINDKSRVAVFENYFKKYFKIKSVKPSANSVMFEVEYD